MEEVNPKIAGADDQAGPSLLPADGPPDQAPPSQVNEPPAKKPKLENPVVQGLKAEALAEGGKLPGSPRTPRLAREVSPSNPLLNMSARQMAKKEQEALKEEERRKRAENEELLKAQRKAARHAALEHKEEETRSLEELVGQVVWAKVGTYPWWPAQIVDPAMVDTQSLSGRKSDSEVLARFFGTYD